MLQAITFAAGVLFSIILGKIAIPWLTRLKIGQYIREEGPKAHFKKAGTPTMGGIIFVVSSLLALGAYHLLSGKPVSTEEALVQGLALSYALCGFIDDFRKVRYSRSLGLRAREKMALQIIFASFFMLWATSRGSSVIVPFSGKVLDFSVLYGAFGVFLIVGAGNAVNFTDGLDGLATGVVMSALTAYAYISGKAPIVGAQQLQALCLAWIGALAGFLVYNYHPAKVFMGDTGSLALGGVLAGVAIATRTELVLVFTAFVPGVEMISVILQVASFQIFGKRIFKMSPLHHHFELSGWEETTIVWVFWAVAAIMAFIGLLSMALV